MHNPLALFIGCAGRGCPPYHPLKLPHLVGRVSLQGCMSIPNPPVRKRLRMQAVRAAVPRNVCIWSGHFVCTKLHMCVRAHRRGRHAQGWPRQPSNQQHMHLLAASASAWAVNKVPWGGRLLLPSIGVHAHVVFSFPRCIGSTLLQHWGPTRAGLDPCLKRLLSAPHWGGWDGGQTVRVCAYGRAHCARTPAAALALIPPRLLVLGQAALYPWPSCSCGCPGAGWVAAREMVHLLFWCQAVPHPHIPKVWNGSGCMDECGKRCCACHTAHAAGGAVHGGPGCMECRCTFPLAAGAVF